MAVNMNIRIVANENNLGFLENNRESSEKEHDSNSIDARKLNIFRDIDGRIKDKKDGAMKQAMKLISDAWEKDDSVSKGLDELKKEKEAMLAQASEKKDLSKEYSEKMQNLKQEYGINEESSEYKDLILLVKYQNNRNGASFDSFSKEEIERLKELENIPLTDFQKEYLRLNDIKSNLDKDARQSEDIVKGINGIITDTRINRNKSRNMEKAQNAADKIMEAAGEDIISILRQESKQHIDDVSEAEQEKAKKLLEERDKEKERIEEEKEKRKEQEEIISGQTDVEKIESHIQTNSQSVNHVVNAQKEIAKLIKENNLINEDIKGIEIDFNF